MSLSHLGLLRASRSCSERFILEPLGAVFARGNEVKSLLAALGVVLLDLGSLLGRLGAVLVALGRS